MYKLILDLKSGFAFVNFANAADAEEAAREMQGVSLGDQTDK